RALVSGQRRFELCRNYFLTTLTLHFFPRGVLLSGFFIVDLRFLAGFFLLACFAAFFISFMLISFVSPPISATRSFIDTCRFSSSSFGSVYGLCGNGLTYFFRA